MIIYLRKNKEALQLKYLFLLKVTFIQIMKIRFKDFLSELLPLPAKKKKKTNKKTNDAQHSGFAVYNDGCINWNKVKCAAEMRDCIDSAVTQLCLCECFS